MSPAQTELQTLTQSQTLIDILSPRRQKGKELASERIFSHEEYQTKIGSLLDLISDENFDSIIDLLVDLLSFNDFANTTSRDEDIEQITYEKIMSHLSTFEQFFISQDFNKIAGTMRLLERIIYKKKPTEKLFNILLRYP